MLGTLGIFLAIAVLVLFFRWWTVGRYIQSTNDAYLDADQVIVAPKVQGYIAQVYVIDNQEVQPGQALVRIDPREYEAALRQAQATVHARTAEVERALAALTEQKANSEHSAAELGNARSMARYADREVRRFAPLAASGADTEEHLDTLQHDREAALGTLRATAAAATASRSSIESAAAQVSLAQAQLEASRESEREAELNFDDTVVKSSINGRVGDRSVRVGQYVQPGSRLMTLVPVQDVYLTANFKETQIGRLRAGQPAKIYIDALGGTPLHGSIESFSPGTGAQFALLPPENATGNFTKIVQRVPVRIRIEASAAVRKLLIPGLSVTVEVDTRATGAEGPKGAKDAPT
jgi:membrane fusion protein (multidrug efflux system)